MGNVLPQQAMIVQSTSGRRCRQLSLYVFLQSSQVPCGFPRLLVCRQDRQIFRPVRLPELGEQAREVERLPTERDRPIPAWPLAGMPVPGKLDPVEIWIVQVDGLVGAVIGGPVDRPA